MFKENIEPKEDNMPSPENQEKEVSETSHETSEKVVGRLLDDLKINTSDTGKSLLSRAERAAPDGESLAGVTDQITGIEAQKVDIIDGAKQEVENINNESRESQSIDLTKTEVEFLENFKNKKIQNAESDSLKETDPIKIEKKKRSGVEAADGLESRYESKETKAEYVLNQIKEFSKLNGAEYKNIPEIDGKPFSPENKKIIIEAVQKQIDTLLLSTEKGRGRFQEKKHESVSNEMMRYADLISQAQEEGDIDMDVSSEVILQKLQENVASLAFQDEAASENLMGDHGIRHLVQHNIKIAEDILSGIEKHGGTVKAIDRIMAHQIMIDHDLGYAMDPVRNSINEEGIKGQDAGHNLLAAKYMKERGSNTEDKINQLFNQEQINTMHSGILNHDSSEVNINFDNSSESRKKNLESAIHIADNTHAFEDKLPEVLYAVPESLKTMRLLKAVGEIGEDTLIEKLKLELIDKIHSNPEYTDGDKKALSMAANGLTGENYKFSVGRICGNKPEVSINESGGVEIMVRESAIHQESVKLFGQKAYDQLHKFVADITGASKLEVAKEMQDPNKTEIGNEKVRIGLNIGENKSNEKTDYQKNIEMLIMEPKFREFTEQDDVLGKEQKALESVGELAQVEKIKNSRKDLIIKYLE